MADLNNKDKGEFTITDPTNDDQSLTVDTDGRIQVKIHGYDKDNALWQPLRIDRSSRAMETIDYRHHEIHNGNHFFVQGQTDVTGAATNFDVLIIVPNTTSWPHAFFHIRTEDEFVIVLYEGTTVSANGVALAEVDNNRNTANTAGGTTFFGPTVTTTGTSILSSKTGSAGSFGGQSQLEYEIILAQNTNYLFRLTKSGAGTHWIDFKLEWYEHAEAG